MRVSWIIEKIPFSSPTMIQRLRSGIAPLIDGDALTGGVTFAPKGISAKADEWLGLFKAWGHSATFPTL